MQRAPLHLAGPGAGNTAKMTASEGFALPEVTVYWGFNSNDSSTSHLLRELPVGQPGFQPSGFISLSFSQPPSGDVCFKYSQGEVSFPLQTCVCHWPAGPTHHSFPILPSSPHFPANVSWLLSLSRRPRGMGGSRSWMFLLNVQRVLRFLTQNLIHPPLSSRSERPWW